MRLQIRLRLLPGLRVDDRRHRAGDKLPFLLRALPKLVQALVAGVDDDIPDPCWPPQARGSLLTFPSRDESVITLIGAGDTEFVQSLCDEEARTPFHGRQPVDHADDIGF